MNKLSAHNRVALAGVLAAGMCAAMAGAVYGRGFGGALTGTDTQNPIWFFPNDTATVEIWAHVGYGDPDLCGYKVSELFVNPPGMWLSLEQDSVVTDRTVDQPGWPQPGGIHWFFPIFIRKTTANEGFPCRPTVTVEGRYMDSGGGGGISVGAGVSLAFKACSATPTIPRTEWTLHNSSAYDIVDGTLILNPVSSPAGNRYLHFI